MTNSTSPAQSDDRLGWRVAEFCQLIGISPATISKMAKAGKITLVYFGDLPVIPRAEAVRLGLISN
jgi:DNA-binding Xre family transcriptional regulator